MFISHTESLCKFYRKNLNATNVSVSDLVLGIYRHRESFDCRHVELIQLLHVVLRVLDSVERSSVTQVRDHEKRQNDADSSDVYRPRVRNEQSCCGDAAEIVETEPGK